MHRGSKVLGSAFKVILNHPNFRTSNPEPLNLDTHTTSNEGWIAKFFKIPGLNFIGINRLMFVDVKG